MMRLGLTGASGFVGRALWARADAAGFETIATGRVRTAAQLPGGRFRIVDDPWSPGAWAKVFNDVDCVVHLVGRAHHVGEGSGAYDAYVRDNVLVSDALMAGLERTSATKVIYLSSVKAIGERTERIAINADTVPAPTTPYGRTKLDAENRFDRWSADTSTDLVVLRPPLVYGPRVKGNFMALLRVADTGLPLPIGDIENERSMIYLENLCDAILASASKDVRGIHRLPVTDRERLSTAEVVAVLRAALGRQPRMYRFPTQVLGWLARAAGKEGQLQRLAGDLVVDGRLAEEVLGWSPRKTTIEGLVETARWFETFRR